MIVEFVSKEAKNTFHSSWSGAKDMRWVAMEPQPCNPNASKVSQKGIIPKPTFSRSTCLHTYTCSGVHGTKVCFWINTFSSVFKTFLFWMKRLLLNFFAKEYWKNGPLAAFVCVYLHSFNTIVHFHGQMFDNTDVLCIHFRLTHLLLI